MTYNVDNITWLLLVTSSCTADVRNRCRALWRTGKLHAFPYAACSPPSYFACCSFGFGWLLHAFMPPPRRRRLLRPACYWPVKTYS